MDKKVLEQMAGAKKLLGNFRIIGAPDQIVERNIEEIGELYHIFQFWTSGAIFKFLPSFRQYPDCLGKTSLSKSFF